MSDLNEASKTVLKHRDALRTEVKKDRDGKDNLYLMAHNFMESLEKKEFKCLKNIVNNKDLICEILDILIFKDLFMGEDKKYKQMSTNFSDFVAYVEKNLKKS